MTAPDVRDYLEPAVNAAGQVFSGVRLHCGKRAIIIQVTPAMSGQWQYREVAKVLQPVLDKVFAEGRRSVGANDAGPNSRAP